MTEAYNDGHSHGARYFYGVVGNEPEIEYPKASPYPEKTRESDEWWDGFYDGTDDAESSYYS